MPGLTHSLPHPSKAPGDKDEVGLDGDDLAADNDDYDNDDYDNDGVPFQASQPSPQFVSRSWAESGQVWTFQCDQGYQVSGSFQCH